MEKAKQAMAAHQNCGNFYHAKMEQFKWTFSYSAIFMVWCAGYLDRPHLVAFLRQAQKHLIKKEGKGARNAPPASFIFLVDNVLPKDDDTNESKNQLLRTQKELESIFKAAELRKYGEPVEHIMPEDYENIMVWALY